MPTLPGSSSPARGPLAAACADALAAARWDQADLATRWPGVEARALLLAKAAECALSALARDQLLSLAIERVVYQPERESGLLEGAPDASVRAAIAKRVFALGPNKASETDALVTLAEGRHGQNLHGRAAPESLSARLREDAALHELLWDDPRVPAGDHARLAMLCAIPRLRDRADQLAARSSWLSRLRGLASLVLAGRGR